MNTSELRLAWNGYTGRLLSGALLATVTSLASVGCVATVEEADGNGGQGGGGNGGSGNGGSGNGGSGGACSAYLDETSADAVTVNVVNETGQPIYLDKMCDFLSYDVTPITGDDSLAYRFDQSCLSTCETAQSGEIVTCAQACALTTVLVAAGETYSFEWAGTALDGQVAMPETCWFNPDAGGAACSQVLAAPADDYRFDIAAYDSCMGFGVTGDCDCAATGECSGEATGNQAFAEGTVSFPEDNVVDVVFGACAFGCADGTAPQSP